MKNNQESKSFWKGKGFYLALTLVIAGAATASFLAINSMMDKLGADPAPQIQGEEDIPWQEEQHTPVEEKQEDVPWRPHRHPRHRSRKVRFHLRPAHRLLHPRPPRLQARSRCKRPRSHRRGLGRPCRLSVVTSWCSTTP